MKYTGIITLMFFLFIQHNVFGQNIVGRVVDSTETPLEFVNVVYLSVNDSTFINGTVTDAYGNFSIPSKGKQGFLRFTRIGYSPFVIKSDSLQFIKKVVLSEEKNILNEVVVKSHLPKTQLNGEGMMTTIAGSFLEKAGNLEHVLSYIPNVVVIGGEVQVFGRGVPEYYLNGHKVIDQMELKTLKSDEIKNIEVINNPGARYSADTKCVIRITTKSHRWNGWGLDLNSSNGINEQNRFSTTDAISLIFHHNKFDVSGSIYCDYSNTEEDKQLRQFTYLQNFYEKNNSIVQKHKILNPYAKLAASYQINDSSSLGVSVSYDRYAKNNGCGTLDAIVKNDAQLTESSHSDYESLASSTSVTTNAYYTGHMGNMTVDINVDYYWSDQDEHMNNYEWVISNNNTENVKTLRVSNSYQLASKVNLSVPLVGGRFLFGGEFSNSERKSRYDVLPANLLNNERSIVKENMYSAFCDYNRHIGKLSVLLGLRYERNNYNYYNHGEYVPSQSKYFNNVFPSLSVSYPIGQSQMQITYASDIKRPSYYQLRDGIQYDNRYIYESGNPYLLPSISRNLGVDFTWNWMTFSAIYSHVSDEICSIVKPYVDNVQISVRQPENMDSYEKFQANISFSPSLGFWHPQLKVGIVKQWFYFPNHDLKSLCNPMGIFHINNTIDTKWFTASLLITAQTEGNTSNSFTYGFWNTDFSLYKALLKDRFIMQLYVNDLFGTANQRRIIYSGKQSSTYIKSFSSSSIGLTLRYVFNAKSEKYKGTGAGLRQRSRL